ncbi:hypothetical protein JCM5353_000872 [Sporobolomyces roseus]
MLRIEMSFHQNGSTSSNHVKQEEERDDQLSGAPQLAQSPTSLLSLPNDNLLLIYEKVYEDRYNLITADTSLRIAEILINKRIFSLARPLWFKHLSVSESHLDLRLAGIFDDKARRGHLRSLDVDVDNSHYNLVKSALLRLPDLTDLALKLPRDFSPHAFTVLVDAVSSLPALKRLRLRSDKRTKKLADFWKAYLGANPCTEVNVSYSFQGMVLQKEYSGTTTGRLLMVKSFTLTPTTLGFLSPSSWPTFLSLTLWARGGLLAWNDEVLEGLETAIENEVCPLCSALLFGPRFHDALAWAGNISRTTQAPDHLPPLQESGNVQMFRTEGLRAATPAFTTHQSSAASTSLARTNT